MFCHKCGTQLEDGQVFCHKCGTKMVYDEGTSLELSTPSSTTENPPDSGGILRRCPACKAINNGFAKICSECGADMDALKAATEAQTADPKPDHQNEAPEENPKPDYSRDTYSVNDNQSAAYIPPKHIYAEETEPETRPAYSEPYVKQGPDPVYSSYESKASGFKAWWQDLTGLKKALIIIGTVAAVILVLALLGSNLFKAGLILIGLVLAIGFIVAIFTGSKEEKSIARRAIMGIVSIVVEIAIFGGIIFAFNNGTLDEGIILDIIKPGYTVRDSHFSQYSDRVTIEEAFDNYFSNGKWSTYKSEGYKYVVFTGSCMFADEPADARIVFKITGQQFRADSLEINGVDMGALMLASLLDDVYEEY